MYWRTISVNDEIWKFHIGRTKIFLLSPNNVKYIRTQSQITGMNWDSLERGYWKKWFKGIGPKMIQEYILKMDKNIKDDHIGRRLTNYEKEEQIYKELISN